MVLNTLRTLRPFRNQLVTIKFLLAKEILQPQLELGLWPLLPMDERAMELFEEVDLQIMCFILGIHFSLARSKQMYKSMCIFLGELPLRERLWLRLQQAAATRLNQVHMATHRASSGAPGVPPRPAIIEKKPPDFTITPASLAMADTIEGPPRYMLHPEKWPTPFDSLIVAPSKEAAKEAHGALYTDTSPKVMAYADGSVKSTSAVAYAGGGIYVRSGDAQVSLFYPCEELIEQDSTEVELFAIAHALEYVQAQEPCLNIGLQPTIYILSDSQSALHQLFKSIKFNSHRAVDKARSAARELRASLPSGSRLILYWIPGHQGIAGNEEADRLAKMGSNHVDARPITEETIVAAARDEAWRQADAWAGCCQMRSHLQLPYDARRGYELRSGKQVITTVQARRRYMFFSGHFFSRTDPLTHCPLCKEKEGFALPEVHLLKNCPILERSRVAHAIAQPPGDDAPGDWILQAPLLDKYLQLVERLVQMDTETLHAAIVAGELTRVYPNTPERTLDRAESSMQARLRPRQDCFEMMANAMSDQDEEEEDAGIADSDQASAATLSSACAALAHLTELDGEGLDDPDDNLLPSLEWAGRTDGWFGTV